MVKMKIILYFCILFLFATVVSSSEIRDLDSISLIDNLSNILPSNIFDTNIPQTDVFDEYTSDLDRLLAISPLSINLVSFAQLNNLPDPESSTPSNMQMVSVVMKRDRPRKVNVTSILPLSDAQHGRRISFPSTNVKIADILADSTFDFEDYDASTSDYAIKKPRTTKLAATLTASSSTRFAFSNRMPFFYRTVCDCRSNQFSYIGMAINHMKKVHCHSDESFNNVIELFDDFGMLECYPLQCDKCPWRTNKAIYLESHKTRSHES